LRLGRLAASLQIKQGLRPVDETGSEVSSLHPLLSVPVVALLGACVVASGIVARDPTSRSRRIAGTLAACGGLAAGLEIAWCSVESASLALAAMRVSGVFMLAVGPLCMELVCEEWPRFERRLRIARVLAAGTAAGLALLVLETPRFVSEPLAVDWGFAMRGGDLMWLACLHTLACLGTLAVMLREAEPVPSEAPARRRFLMMGGVLAAAWALDGILALQSLAAPRFAGPALVLAGAVFWRPGRSADDALHPGAFDSEILDALSDGVAVLRNDGRIRAVNASLEALTGISRSQLIDRPLAELLTDAPGDLGRRERLETRLRIEAEEPIPISLSTAPLRDRQGASIGCAVAIRDRREVVDLQRHLVTSARYAAVGELAAGIAHEVNNPLAFVQANLNQMNRDYAELHRLDPAAIQNEGESLQAGETLIRDCLEQIARVASIVSEVRGLAHGGEEPNRLCDVNALLEAAMRMAVPPASAAVRLERCYAELPGLYCSEQDLKQLLLGLVMHAAQPARKARGIRLVTEVLGAGIRVAVEDDGVGYAEESLDRIFEPRVDEHGIEAGEGLGLSIAYHIARQLGGEIEVESELEGSTRVVVMLHNARQEDPLEWSC
jgi:two-component system NtrC family sensor kinase